METVYYDLHIHSALSPCAGNDMTPNDIIGMALLNGLDLIAVTDHNSISNAVSVVKAAENIKSEKELIVLPGIEVSTEEEVHVICLFDGVESALSFDAALTPYYSLLPNRVDIFGRQIIFDEFDNEKSEETRMLIAPAAISFDNLYKLVHEHGGAFIPAHVDRSSFSVISNLGFMPPHLNITAIEVSLVGAQQDFINKNADMFSNNKVIYSSDAHELWSISEKENCLMLPDRTASAAIDYLR